MLYIDNKQYEITKEEISVGNFTNNGIKGYDLNLELEFKYNSKMGFLNLSVGFSKDKNINNFLNRIYKGIPYNIDDNQINFFEVFDTEKFLDTEIESEIILNVESIEDDKVKVFLTISDVFINIIYNNCLNIK